MIEHVKNPEALSAYKWHAGGLIPLKPRPFPLF
jgi:hypothetical protein